MGSLGKDAEDKKKKKKSWVGRLVLFGLVTSSEISGDPVITCSHMIAAVSQDI